MENTWERLLARLRKYAGSVEINEETKVYHDLKISGDDALELLGDLRDEFGTDFSKLNFSEYFPEESEAFPEHLARLLGSGAARKPLSVGHLLQVVRVGQWQEPSA
jgi:hypothetical protein